MNLKLAPGKIAIKHVEPKLKSGLMLPENRAKSFDIAEITHIGDQTAFGHKLEESTNENFQPGNVILFQLPTSLAGMTAHTIQGERLLILNVGDIVARLTNPKDEEGKVLVNVAGFKIAGRFILLQTSVRRPASAIIVPDSADEATKGSLHFSVLQKGADVTIDVNVGQEVFPHKGRVSPMIIDGQNLSFVDHVFIDGVLAED